MGILIEFGGLPGTGKSTLAAHLADRIGAVLLRIDVIDAAMRRAGRRRRREYQPRHDERLVLDTTRPVIELHEEIDRYLTTADQR